jgi:hypothetical protein
MGDSCTTNECATEMKNVDIIVQKTRTQVRSYYMGAVDVD